MATDKDRRVLIEGQSEYNPVDTNRVHVTLDVFRKRYEPKGYTIVTYSDGEEYLTPDEIKARKEADAKAKEDAKAKAKAEADAANAPKP